MKNRRMEDFSTTTVEPEAGEEVVHDQTRNQNEGTIEYKTETIHERTQHYCQERLEANRENMMELVLGNRMERNSDHGTELRSLVNAAAQDAALLDRYGGNGSDELALTGFSIMDGASERVGRELELRGVMDNGTGIQNWDELENWIQREGARGNTEYADEGTKALTAIADGTARTMEGIEHAKTALIEGSNHRLHTESAAQALRDLADPATYNPDPTQSAENDSEQASTTAAEKHAQDQAVNHQDERDKRAPRIHTSLEFQVNQATHMLQGSTKGSIGSSWRRDTAVIAEKLEDGLRDTRQSEGDAAADAAAARAVMELRFTITGNDGARTHDEGNYTEWRQNYQARNKHLEEGLESLEKRLQNHDPDRNWHRPSLVERSNFWKEQFRKDMTDPPPGHMARAMWGNNHTDPWGSSRRVESKLEEPLRAIRIGTSYEGTGYRNAELDHPPESPLDLLEQLTVEKSGKARGNEIETYLQRDGEPFSRYVYDKALSHADENDQKSLIQATETGAAAYRAEQQALETTKENLEKILSDGRKSGQIDQGAVERVMEALRDAEQQIDELVDNQDQAESKSLRRLEGMSGNSLTSGPRRQMEQRFRDARQTEP